MWEVIHFIIKQDGIDSQRPMPPPPPTAFSVPNRNVLYLRETKLWRCGRGRGRGRGGRETCHLLTHAPARGMGKNTSSMITAVLLWCPKCEEEKNWNDSKEEGT